MTALCLNWVIGTISYYLIPSLGPVFVRPTRYADLPDTGVTALQQQARALVAVPAQAGAAS